MAKNKKRVLGEAALAEVYHWERCIRALAFVMHNCRETHGTSAVKAGEVLYGELYRNLSFALQSAFMVGTLDDEFRERAKRLAARKFLQHEDTISQLLRHDVLRLMDFPGDNEVTREDLEREFESLKNGQRV